jgi:hypothetical protein
MVTGPGSMGARCPRLPDDAPRPDLLLFENDEVPGVPLNDVQEVSHYVAALNHGLDRLRGGFPFSLRLIREIHEVLLSKGRGSDKQPGEFRESQNWIGGTRPGTAVFVPPPPELILDYMSAPPSFSFAAAEVSAEKNLHNAICSKVTFAHDLGKLMFSELPRV